MNGFLSLVEKLVPRLLLYPRWAQVLFTATFALTLTSLFVFVALGAAADRREQTSRFRSSIGLEVVPTNSSDYKAATLQPALQVGPAQPYLATLASKDGVIHGVGLPSELWTDSSMPSVQVEVSNNSGKGIVFNPVVSVAQSTLDTTPVPVIVYGLRSFVLHDEGWGRITNATFRFNLTQPGVKPDFSRPLRYRIALAPRTDQRIDLAPALRREGVDIPLVERLARPLKPNEPLPAALRRALGPFRTGEARAYGVLSYSWKTQGGAPAGSQVRFTTPVAIVRAPAVVAGGVLSSSATYHILLPTSGGASRCTISEAHTITGVGTDRGDRFELELDPRRSSIQRFRVLLELDGASTPLTSQDVVAHVFVPRAVAAEYQGNALPRSIHC